MAGSRWRSQSRRGLPPPKGQTIGYEALLQAWREGGFADSLPVLQFAPLFYRLAKRGFVWRVIQMGQYPAPQRPSGCQARQGFTKLIKEITVSAKMGGGDVNFNPACDWQSTRPKKRTCRPTISIVLSSAEPVNWKAWFTRGVSL